MVLTQRGAAGVAFRDMPEPHVPAGWAKVRMRASSVNRVDLYMRASGVLLVILIFGHLLINLVLGEGVKQIDFAFVAGKMGVIDCPPLILLTALQSLDTEQKEAAEMDGAGFLARFWYLTLPHLARAITVVVLIETIFLLSIYAEILVTTNGGPGYASTNLPYLVYQKALLEFKIGQASAGGIIAVILANIVALFLMRAVGKNLDK